MYKIGEFSKITKISARMLRYYDKENLLKPSFTGSNGYRFYTDADIEIITKIKHLRKYHFSYEKIKDILSNHQENDKTIYLNKLEELKNTANDYDTLISDLEAIHNIKNANTIINNYDINISKKQSFDALCKKKIVKSNELDLFIEKIQTKIISTDIQLVGNYFIIFCENHILEEDTFEVKYCQPVSISKEVKEFETEYFEEDLYISTIHYGDYDNLHNAYSSLYKWAADNNFIIKDNFVEKYYVDSFLTSYSDEFITEVSVPICKY